MCGRNGTSGIREDAAHTTHPALAVSTTAAALKQPTGKVVAVILTALVAAANVATEVVTVGPNEGGAVRALVGLTFDHPSAVLRVEDFGPGLMSQLFAVSAIGACTLHYSYLTVNGEVY